MSDEYTKLAAKTKSFHFKIMEIPALVNLLNQCGTALAKSCQRGTAGITLVAEFQRQIRLVSKAARAIRPFVGHVGDADARRIG